MTPEEATQKLFEAAKSGDIDGAQAALDAGADRNAKDKYRQSPWAYAFHAGNSEMKALLQDTKQQTAHAAGVEQGRKKHRGPMTAWELD